MKDETHAVPESDRGVDTKSKRRPYAPPRLEVLGDLRGMTLGGSPGTGDSGNQFTQKPL